MSFSDHRYSQHARRSLAHARLLAEKSRHSLVDTGHLLAGIWLEEGSIGSKALQDFKIERTTIENHLANLHPILDEIPKPPPYTAALKIVFAFAMDEARWLDHHYIGTEHLLLGLVRSGAGDASRLMNLLNINETQIRQKVRRLVNDGILEINLESARRMASLSELSRRVLNGAATLARQYRHPAAGLEHLLMVLSQEQRSIAARLLAESGFARERLASDLLKLQPDAALSAAALDEVIDCAVEQAEAMGTHYTGTDHLLLAMTLDKTAQLLLARCGVDFVELQLKLRENFNV